MDPTVMMSAAVALGLAAAKVIDKAWPTRADAHLQQILETMKSLLSLQQEMKSVMMVERERTNTTICALGRIEGVLMQYVNAQCSHGGVVAKIQRHNSGV
jgi:hypothetical protein